MNDRHCERTRYVSLSTNCKTWQQRFFRNQNLSSQHSFSELNAFIRIRIWKIRVKIYKWQWLRYFCLATHSVFFSVESRKTIQFILKMKQIGKLCSLLYIRWVCVVYTIWKKKKIKYTILKIKPQSFRSKSRTRFTNLFHTKETL